MDMELTYIYHSGFALSGDGFTVIMDYYRDSEDGQAQADLNRLIAESPIHQPVQIRLRLSILRITVIIHDYSEAIA